MPIPYSFDQVVDAIASTRGEGAHFVLLQYLTANREAVGVERFKQVLATADMRNSDRNSVHFAIAKLDPSYSTEVVNVFLSQRSTLAQQELLINLPEVLPRERNDEVANQLSDWLRRRVRRPSYLISGDGSEIPSIIRAVLHTSDTAHARALLRELAPQHLMPPEEAWIQKALLGNDNDFEIAIDDWRFQNGGRPREITPEETEYYERKQAEYDQEAAKYMRRLGFQPTL